MHQSSGGPPPEAYLRPPASKCRPRRNSSIRTCHNPSLSRQASSSSSSQSAVNVERKPIPLHKLQHASKLYRELRMKEGLAQRSPDPDPNTTSPSSIGSFSAPGLPGPLTIGSRSSKGQTVPSFDAISEYSSVISFDTASQSSAKSGRRNEAVSYKGSTVTQRTRRRLPPVDRAKTALIRYLGACQHCKSRNVKCPLEHHYIESLELAHQSNSIKQEFASHDYSPTSPTCGPQIENAPSGQAAPATSRVHNEALVGIGSFFAPEVPLDRELVFSIAPDPLPESSPGQEDVHGLSDLIIFDYSLIKHGCQFPLGVWDNLAYKCHYAVDGDCQQSFADPEALQAHFETSHFAFTRIDPPLRCICTQCCFVNTNYACNCGGLVKLFVCGNYIKTTQYPPEPPTSQPNNHTVFNTPKLYSDLSHAYSEFIPGLGLNANMARDFGNNTGASLYGNGRNMYPSPNAGGFNTYNYDSTQPGGNRYNRHAWTLTRGVNKAAIFPVRYCVTILRQASKHQRFLVSILLTLILITTGLQLYHWIASTIMSKMDEFLPTLPTVGSLGFIISFITSWAARHIYYIHKSKRCKMRQYPLLHAFTRFANQYGQRGPPVLIYARVS